MIPFRRTCKEVATLVIAREDRKLPWQDGLALRLHMAVCAACPTFERQVLTMSHAMKQWRASAGQATPDTGDDKPSNQPP